jgi:hypothetical protein
MGMVLYKNAASGEGLCNGCGGPMGGLTEFVWLGKRSLVRPPQWAAPQ